MKHRILREALAELDEASTWREEQEEGLGLALVAEYRERAYPLRCPNAGALAGSAPPPPSSCTGAAVHQHF